MGVVVLPIDPHEFVCVIGRDVSHLPPERGPDVFQQHIIVDGLAEDLFGGVPKRREDETDGIDQCSVEVEQNRADG